MACAAAFGTGGCFGGDEDSAGGSSREAATERATPAPKGSAPRAGEPPEAGQVRGWSDALNAGDYRRAASFFAEGAIIEQGGEIRLRDRAAAIAFNRSLPCRATVTEVEDEKETVLATFRLRQGDGPEQVCGGIARVRFKFKDGKFSEWRQLAETMSEGQPA